MDYVSRTAEVEIRKLLTFFPAVGILGPRQIGKTTLAKRLVAQSEEEVIYLDLENPDDRQRLESPNLFLDRFHTSMIILDEVQQMPEIFPILRGAIDRNRRPGKFILLGSASPTLLRTSGESLAGRIAYRELSGFGVDELKPETKWADLWMRGGFPESYLSINDQTSFEWRKQFIQTYTSRELQLLGATAEANLLLRMWSMVAYAQGQLINFERLGNSLGVTGKTAKSYLAFFEQSYLIKQLKPYHANLKKRLVKQSKVFVSDSGILHALLNIQSEFELSGRIERGASFEGFVIMQILARLPLGVQPYFYRTSAGAEIDLLLEKGGKPFIAIEIKASSSPKLTKGFHMSCNDLNIEHRFIIALIDTPYPTKHDIEVIGIKQIDQVLSLVN